VAGSALTRTHVLQPVRWHASAHVPAAVRLGPATTLVHTWSCQDLSSTATMTATSSVTAIAAAAPPPAAAAAASGSGRRAAPTERGGQSRLVEEAPPRLGQDVVVHGGAVGLPRDEVGPHQAAGAGASARVQRGKGTMSEALSVDATTSRQTMRSAIW
jgi:hypothetical protein